MSNQMPGSDSDATPLQQAQALKAYVKLMRSAGAVTSQVHGYLAVDGVSTSQFGVLEALLHCGPLQQCELGQKILKSSGNITFVVDNLERRGLVTRERHCGDRRRITVELTAAGRELIQRLFPLHVRQVCQAMGALTSTELAQLARLCKKLGLANTAPPAAPRNQNVEVLSG
jgi:MarR family transcriptional regulator, 2-MHQ and catechol-resistance regulon repressor